MDNFPISIVVPNYNGRKILRQTLPFIVKAPETYAGPSEIIVVDDASSNDSVNIVEEKFPE